jgi:hypothetical protein
VQPVSALALSDRFIPALKRFRLATMRRIVHRWRRDVRKLFGRSRLLTSRESGSTPRWVIEAFRATLIERGVPATVRLTRGRDIAAACGRLAASAAAPAPQRPVGATNRR